MLEETGGFTDEHRENIRKATLEQYDRGFDPNNHHRSGNHISPKAGTVFHRSSYEKKAFILLDSMPEVESYEVEKIRIPYEDPRDNSHHIFVVDISVKFKDGTLMAIEVKPNIWLNSIVNSTKLKALEEWSFKNNCRCEVWDEFLLFGQENIQKKIEKFVSWVDSGLSIGEEHLISEEEIELRRAKARIKAKKYYDNHIANEQVKVECTFCNETHSVLKITYENKINL